MPDPGPVTRAKDRRQAALAGHTGDETTARALLAHSDGAVRATALGALIRMGAASAADIARASSDGDPIVRRRSAEVAAHFDWADPTPILLVRLLADPDNSVAEMAAWAAGERTPTESGSVEALASVATDHEDALCREAAVAALGAIGDVGGKRAILAALDDKAAVRRRAVIALAPFDGPDVEAALTRALDDRDRQVRQAAEDQLGRGDH